MSDPAVEAAQRAHDRLTDGMCTASLERHRITAAREALAPIRELHRVGLTDNPYYDNDKECIECREDWPCATARLVYPSEEL